ncbi:MAG TPA: cyclic nucleotide-binding domain-containing protein [Thioploca sp.]|nr:MAG: hypothetical protein DRR19_17325 [Gammaproteobacteria bacterium]HDN26583.1 cyclic nucleotide-binding domain-containing protein [Thioploca sp.]
MKNLMPELYKILGKNPIFNDCSPEKVQQLVELLDEPIHFSPGDFILREGEPPSAMYILFQGNVEVVKKDNKSARYHQLEVLKPGAFVGEMALIDAEPRSADVRALDDVTLLVLPLGKMNKISPSDLDIPTQLKLRLAKTVAERLRSTNENVVRSLEAHLEEAKARAALGYLTSYMLITSCIFMLVLGALTNMVDNPSSTLLITLPIIIFYALTIGLVIHRSGYPLSNYGMTTKNWRVALKESFWATLVVALATILFKWYLVTMTESMANDPIFDIVASADLSLSMFIMICIFYALFAPLQEFIIRGGLQGALQMFLTGSPKRRTWGAILVANLMYSVSHVVLSMNLVFLTFIIGLLWGWLYSRHGTLIGVSFSHIFIGLFAFFVVGFQKLLGA